MTQSSRPGVTIEASQQTLIEALPSILVLHLKRFLYDTKVGDVVKVSKQIKFGPELEIGGDMMTPARRAQGGKYKLFGGTQFTSYSFSVLTEFHHIFSLLSISRLPPWPIRFGRALYS
jgi:hypothetical protein